MFLNIHTHSPAGPHEWAIQNLHNHFEKAAEAGHFSLGLHPWYLNEHTYKAELLSLQQMSRQDYVLAIGECGLDKICKTPAGLQEKVFREQLLWANEINKPLIIHCVKAHNEVLKMIQTCRSKVPVIFHGFNKSKHLALSILDAGHWLSFGKALHQTSQSKIFALIPAERFFLETDQAGITIEQQYALAGKIRNLSADQLDRQLKENANTVFKVNID